jgi:hypothetical protein
MGRIVATARALALVVIMLLVPTLAAADGGTGWAVDANSGHDASGSSSSAMALAYGTFPGNVSAGDVDWFAFPGSTAPACVRLEITAATDVDATLQVDTPAGAKSFPVHVASGSVRTAAVAVGSADRVLLNVREAGSLPRYHLASYRFTVSTMGTVDASSGDAFTAQDAGSIVSGSVGVPGECFGGWMTFVSGILDTRDLYAINVPAGQSVVYSISAPSGVSATLEDASGAPVGATLGGGSMASTAALPAGIYYLDVGRSAAASDVTYLLTAVLTDPGNPCRPQC